MKFKTMMLLGVAVACGLIAMVGVQQLMSAPTEENPDQEEVQVLFATADIDAWIPLDESNTTFKTMARKDVPPGAVVTREECEERRLKYGVVENDVILFTKLTEKNPKPSREIVKGMRIVTVKVNQTKTHSGLIRPGDSVDVMLTYKVKNIQSRAEFQRSQVILQNVRVFATGSRRRVNNKEEETEFDAKNMSLMVTPDDANLLMLAEATGQLTMALRQDGEPIVEDLKPLTSDRFFKNFAERDSAPKPETEEPKPEDKNDQQFDKDFQAYLDGQTQFAEVKPQPEVKVEPKPPVEKLWKIQIFNGDKSRIEEVVLVDEEPEPTPTPAPSATPAKGETKPTTTNTGKAVRAYRPTSA